MIKLWKKLIESFSVSDHLKALLIGFLVSVFIVFPFIAALINALLIYIRLIYGFLFMINLLVAIWVFLWTYVYLFTLKDSHDHEVFEFRKTVIIFGCSKALLMFIIGMILILTITPTIL